MKAENWLIRQWRWVRQPTLARRSVITVLATFGLVWVVLLVFQYYLTTSIQSSGLGMRGHARALLVGVNEYLLPDQAAKQLRLTEQYLNTRRRQVGVLPGEFSSELTTLQGKVIYRSKALPPIPIDSKEGAMFMLEHQDRPYAAYKTRSEQWILTVVEPRRKNAEFLLFNGKEFLRFLLVALPFVIIPLWWSMHHGLQPLRQLAQRLDKRSDADLNPIGFGARHAELKPLEHALDELMVKLKERLARERTFVQDAAHELRTPLAVMAAQAHALARTEDAAERAQSQAHLERAIERASHVSSQLLGLAAMDEAAKQAAQTIDLAHWVRQQLASFAQHARRKDMELSLDAPDTLLRAVDIAAMESVLSNLLDNAIRYGHKGGSVAVSLHENGLQPHGFELIVSDDGPGIPEPERSRVFERFYRVPGQTAEGSGLGLAIVLQATKRMGGHVTLTSSLADSGLVATITVPAI
jgi:two-component system, OmpR family, sensor histidine kinase QseC